MVVIRKVEEKISTFYQIYHWKLMKNRSFLLCKTNCSLLSAFISQSSPRSLPFMYPDDIINRRCSFPYNILFMFTLIPLLILFSLPELLLSKLIYWNPFQSVGSSLNETPLSFYHSLFCSSYRLSPLKSFFPTIYWSHILYIWLPMVVAIPGSSW